MTTEERLKHRVVSLGVNTEGREMGVYAVSRDSTINSGTLDGSP